MAGTDRSAAAKVEALAYYDPVFDFYDQVEEIFGRHVVDDITDMDNEDSYEYSYLISLNRDGIRLFSEEIDALLEEEDTYFLNIMVSREKPLAGKCYWKYPRGSRGQELIVSPRVFLEEQADADRLFDLFVRENGLFYLTDRQLQESVLLHGRQVTIYYKYFNRS